MATKKRKLISAITAVAVSAAILLGVQLRLAVYQPTGA